MSVRSCDECKYSGSWHYREDPVTLEMTSYRCPNFLSDELHKQAVSEAQKIAEHAHKAQVDAVKLIIEDKALSLPELSSNNIQKELNLADITDRQAVVGPAFTALARDGKLAPTGRYEPSIVRSTRRKVQLWQSLICRRAAS